MSDRLDKERWAERDELFSRVLELPPGERAEYLASLRDVDDRLRRAVRRLLRMHGEAESFLEQPPLLPDDFVEEITRPSPGDVPVGDDAPAAVPGECVGPWRVVDELGRGGMATVYLVERMDGVYEQTGALKLLRRGLDTDDVLRRFRAERQILSTLTHPGISRLLDGGRTPEGRPYLVMERVEGTPITDWCDARGASIERRLELFVDVAEAVHHAHTKLVVHRDLNPSNILVTPDGGAKLLDFGIAKILDPNFPAGDRPRTRTGHRALTPEYASPEQVRGEPPTTATDVYQLGLLLHGLLTGARPHEARGPSVRLAEEPTPTPLSPSRVARSREGDNATSRGLPAERLVGRLRGDLDAIVLCALETEPEGRYGSALEMAEDVRRHLAGRPIAARPAGRLYRLRKFLGRHRWAGPSAAAILLVLSAFIFTLVRNGRQLRVERDAATEQAERAERIRDVLVGVFRGADPWAADDPRLASEASLASALDIGTSRARQELRDDPELQADLLASIADVYTGREDLEAARKLLEEAVALREVAHRGAGAETAVMRLKLAAVYNRQSRYDTALALARRSLGALEDRASVPDSLVVRAFAEKGYAEKGLGRYDMAEASLLRAWETISQQDVPPAELEALVARDLTLLYTRLDRPEEATTMARQQYRVMLDRFGPDHLMTARARSGLAETLWQTRLSDFEEPVRLQASTQQTFAGLLGPDHPQSLNSQVLLAMMLRSAGRLDEAERELRAAVSGFEALFGPDDARTAGALHYLAAVLYTAGKLRESDEAARRAQAIRTSLGLTARPGLASTLTVRCGIMLHSGELAAAEQLCRRAVGILEAAGFEGGRFCRGRDVVSARACRGWRGRARSSLSWRMRSRPSGRPERCTRRGRSGTAWKRWRPHTNRSVATPKRANCDDARADYRPAAFPSPRIQPVLRVLRTPSPTAA